MTSYNLALAVGSVVLLRVRSPLTAPVGALVFCGASIACAAAPDVWSLIAFRGVQGFGGAALLLGAVPLLRTAARGDSLWTGASVLGAALGPALGGVLTEWLGWRSIFAVQAPVAAACVAAARLIRPVEMPAAVSGARFRAGPATALAFASASLVALLFLAVVELIDIHGLSPLAASAVATAIPAGAVAVAPLAARPRVTTAGAVLLAGGLCGMAFVPGPSLAWPVASLAVAGAGYGLLVPNLTRTLLAGASTREAARVLALRHVGLVAGLLLLTPLLTTDLVAAGNTAELRGIAAVLEAPITATKKLELALDLAPIFGTPAREGVPNLGAAVRRRDPTLADLGDHLDETIRATLTRGFRRSYLVAALLALVAGAAAATRGARLRLIAAAAAVGCVLVGAEFGAGAAGYGTKPALSRPCAGEPGVGSAAERPALAALDLVACGFHEGREQFLADAARRGVAAVAFVERLLRAARLLG